MKTMDGVVDHPTSKALKFALCITMSKVLIGTTGDKSEAPFFLFKLYLYHFSFPIQVAVVPSIGWSGWHINIFLFETINLTIS